MTRLRLGSLLVLLVMVTSSCTPTPDVVTSTSAHPSGSVTTGAPQTTEFSAFVETSFRAIVERHPETLTELGLDSSYGTRPNRLDDLSVAYANETQELVEKALTDLSNFDVASLDAEERVTYLAYEWNLEQLTEAHSYRDHEWPVHFMLNSYNQGVIGLFTQVHPLATRNDADDYLSRLEQLPAQIEQVIEWMERSEALEAVPPGYVLDISVNQMRGDIAGGSATSTFLYRDFADRVGALGLNRATLDDYLSRAEDLISSSFIPSWETLIGALEQVRPDAGDDISLASRPEGDVFYEHLLRRHTSTDLTPTEIHDLGWQEASRIKSEMTDLAVESGLGELTVSEFRDSAVSNRGFVEPSDVTMAYQDIIRSAAEWFEPFFDSIPTAPLEVVNDPGPVAYYVGPSISGDRPAVFHSGSGGGPVPTYTMASLAFHEAIPGHHLQIALAQELPLASPQKFMTSTGHVEGWALYAERLAGDTGFYADSPYSDFGRLDFELLRAARLVVDTGIHHLGWSRSEALSVMSEIMEGDHFNHEVDRYVTFPGQATGYMVGMLAILDLRERLGVAVGDRESLAAFHEMVIGRGNIPLSVLVDVSVDAAES